MPRPVDPSNRGHAEPSLPVPYTGQSYPLVMSRSASHAYPGFIPEPTKPAPWFLDFSGVLRRHWFLVLLGMILSVASGYYLGTRFKTDYWTIGVQLRHMKQPTIDGKSGDYEPMSLGNYADMVTSEEILRPIAAEFKNRLPVGVEPIRYLQKELKVDTPRMSDIIEIKNETPDPQLGIDVLSKLTSDFIDLANKRRQTTILNQSVKVLNHRIVDSDAQIARIERNEREYKELLNSKVPIEKLDAAEIDSYHAQRRKSLLDLIEAERTRIKERKIDLESKKAKLRRIEEHYRLKIATYLEVVDAEAEVRTLQGQIAINERQIETLEDNYRRVPLEYASSRVIDLRTQKVIAEQELKLIEAKTAEAKERGITLLEVGNDDPDWLKLRKRILGADSPEFEVFKPLSWPASPSNSNRKVLTVVGAATPLIFIVLLLGLVDRLRGIHTPVEVGARIESVAPETPVSAPFRDESALLSVRIQQWIVDKPNANGHADSPSGRMVIEPERNGDL